MNARLFYIGVTPQTAPLPVRERLRCDAARQREMLARLGPFTAGRMVLSTCERFEVYAVTARSEASWWVSCLAGWSQLPASVLRPHVRVLGGDPVAEHLLRVAAGLESRIVGEPHILGQVRNAFLQASRLRCLEPSLSALCRAAIHTGKRVRGETRIGRAAPSIITMALERIRRDRGSFTHRTVLIVGTGRLATELAAALAVRRVGRMLIVGRNGDRARVLASRFGGVGSDLADLPLAIARSDVVITCTTAETFLIDGSIIGPRRAADLGLVDLAVPRNVDPAVARLPGVRLLHMEDLVSDQQVDAAPLGRGQACRETARTDARGVSGTDPCAPGRPTPCAPDKIVHEELERFLEWHRQRRIAPIIAAIVRQQAARQAPDPRAAKRRLHARLSKLKQGAAA